MNSNTNYTLSDIQPQDRLLSYPKTFVFLVLFFCLLSVRLSYPQELKTTPDFNRIADSILKAENSRNHPYGVIYKGCDAKHPAFCRRVCLNTLKHQFRAFLSAHPSEISTDAFLPYLSQSYAPLGAKNDPSNLNVNWISNVQYFLNKESL